MKMQAVPMGCVREALNTIRASRWTLLKARMFGENIVIDEGDELIEFANYKGTLYFLDRYKKDEPVIDVTTFIQGAMGFFAALGLISVVMMIGLWIGGFFHYLAKTGHANLFSFLLK